MIKTFTSLLFLCSTLICVSQNCGDIEYASALSVSIDASDTSLVINQALIINTGTCVIPESTLKIYLTESNNTSELTNGFFAGEITIPALTPNQTHDLVGTELDLRLSQATPGSNYYVGFILDANGVIPEDAQNSNNTLIAGGMLVFPGAINTSISASDLQQVSVSTFPVPFSKEVSVNVENLNNKQTILVIRDITGKIVSTSYTSKELTRVNTEELVEGVYFLSVIQNNTTLEVKRLIKSTNSYE